MHVGSTGWCLSNGMGIRCWGYTFSCNWGTGSGNDGVVFGTCGVIGWAGICLGNGIAWCVLNFLLSPALPWPILGLGIGCVGCPLSTGCTNEVDGMLCLGSVGNGLCLPGLTCEFKPLFTPCISGNLMPLDLASDLVCIRYLLVSGQLVSLLIRKNWLPTRLFSVNDMGINFMKVTLICLLSR